jgi:ligand-binding SRPBCC domain-containing protein
MPILYLKTYINAPIEIVFDLSRSIDLHKISTKETNEEAISGVTSGLIGLNQTVTWRAKHFGIYQKLTSKITEYKYPTFFVDEMVSGAFKSLKHQHIFQLNNNQTIMEDVFEYQSPFGVLGKLVDNVFLEKYMFELLNKRNQTIKEFAESEKWKEILK